MNTTKDFVFQHEEVRKKLWCDAWVSTANANDCKSTDSATRWADDALKEFDARFPAPKQEPDDLEDLKRRYTPEQLQKMWEEAYPKSSEIIGKVIITGTP